MVCIAGTLWDTDIVAVAQTGESVQQSKLTCWVVSVITMPVTELGNVFKVS